jgi:hypothetical protein
MNLLKHSAPSPLLRKSEKKQGHGMHFDGIVAGLNTQGQKKMAKKR